MVVISSTAQVLVNGSGTQGAPLRNLSILGLGFRDTAFTYFLPHAMPSAGDWALARSAALFFEGTEGLLVSGCVFERLDGTALMLSGYTRGGNVSHNEFAWLGETAIAQWGYTTGDPEGVDGPDGTDGNQPRGTYVGFNYVHELGVWEKQAAFYFQAKTSDTLLERNIVFNGPRAGINFNDGFAGGSVVTRNVIFNVCRESGDHGSVRLLCIHAFCGACMLFTAAAPASPLLPSHTPHTLSLSLFLFLPLPCSTIISSTAGIAKCTFLTGVWTRRMTL